MKICTKCKQNKSLEEFHVHILHKDKLSSNCKQCVLLSIKNHHEKYPWKQPFRDIKKRCNNPKNKFYKNYGGRGIKCSITEEEINFLWFRDNASEMKIPTIDRIDNDGDYELSNCRFIEKSLNVARKDQKYHEKQVNQYDVAGNFIRTWKSGQEIQRKLGICKQSISLACRNKTKTAHNYIWKFAGKDNK